MPQNKSKKSHPESGNVFIFILLGVVLFAALSFSVSRGFRSSTTSAMSAREAELTATDIITYAQRVERAVNRLRRNGCSENEISFENAQVSGYSFTTRDKCKVFDSTGGKLSYAFPSNIDSAGFWMFSGRSCITGVGPSAEGTNCWSDSLDNEELVIILPRMTSREVCESLNKSLHDVRTINQNTGDGDWDENTKKFVGVFTDSNRPEGQPVTGADSFCFEDDDKEEYHFIHTLIAR